MKSTVVFMIGWIWIHLNLRQPGPGNNTLSPYYQDIWVSTYRGVIITLVFQRLVNIQPGGPRDFYFLIYNGNVYAKMKSFLLFMNTQLPAC